MNVVRCPRCDAAVWDTHCDEVNCGWVVCVYCYDAVIYDWQERTMLVWERKSWQG